MAGNLEFGPERRRCLRQSLHAPAFASFDGVSGGMILDLSEEGLSMQTDARLERERWCSPRSHGGPPVRGRGPAARQCAAACR